MTLLNKNYKSTEKQLQEEIDNLSSETEKDLENFDPENVKEEKEDEKEEKKQEKKGEESTSEKKNFNKKKSEW